MRDLFHALAPHLPAGRRFALNNLWLTGPFVMRSFAKEPFQAALLRTTTAATMFEGALEDPMLGAAVDAVGIDRIRAIADTIFSYKISARKP